MSARAVGRSLVRPPVHPLRRLSLLAAGLVALALGGAVAPADAPAAATFRAVADAHVSSSSPASNLGRAKWLATDARPTKVAYLRFDPTDLSGTVTRATLRVYARSRHPTGFQVRRVASTRWRERRIRYTNAPSVSSTVLSRSGAFARGRWVYVDVTPAIRGNGGVSLALKTTSKRSLLVASREAGSARAPRLVVETAAAGGGPGPMPQTTPELTHEAGPDFERRPYTDGSPWNTKLPAGVPVNPSSAAAIATIGGPLTSDTGQYTYPLYLVDSSAPLRPVSLSGLYSDVRGGQNDDSLLRQSEATVNVPISAEMDAANGSDAQIIIVNPSTGDEWGFWKLRKNSGGNWSATNGYHYNVRWDAHPPRDSSDRAFGSRGAGVPYFAGLVRPWEIRLGRVDHALAFAYDYPSYEWIYPASKSDGNSAPPALPEGARLQLDPSLTETELRGRGCNTTAVTIARAMQEYGMYVIDNSGSDKIMLEYSGTADWAGLGAERSTPSCIPVDRLRWVDWR